MIGGTDIILHGETKPQDADLLVRSIRSEWPGALVQRAEEVQGIPIREFRFPIVGPAELFVYRDDASYQSWHTHGATADNQDTMIHLIVTANSVTLVVDNPASALADIARELLGALQANRIVLPKAA